LERLLDEPPTVNGPHPSHRQPKARRLPVSGRLTLGIGLSAALVAAGIAVGTGAVRTPLSDTAEAKAPQAETLTTAPSLTLPSVNSASYALATVPASLRAHPKTSPSAKHSAKATPSASVTPTVTPTGASSTAPSSSGLTPTATAENQTPTGTNQEAWSEAILTQLGDPLTPANIESIGYWMQNEAGSPPSGIVGANNPINVSEPGYGGWAIQSDGNGINYLMSYPTVTDGLEAIAAFLSSGSYPTILADLKSGIGLMTDPNLASNIEEFSGDHYSTIPDSWGESQGVPLS
jgi:hypothetical protein